MDTSLITVDLAPVYVLATTLVTALVGLMAVRKVIKTANRT